MKSINPATGKIIRTYQEHTPSQCDEIIDKVFDCWKQRKNTSFEERSQRMNRAADILVERKQELALLITREMGKIIRESVAEVEKSAWVCRYYAENAEAFLRDEKVESDALQSFVSFEPLGPVLAVMPWNFPFWQVFRFAAPALMAGNAALLKHASNVPGCALIIEEVFIQAGFPKNLFRTLLIPGSGVEHILENDKIKAATLTGSEYAGSKVAAACGANLKKTVLELGGSDPYIVLADADLDKCVKTALVARMLNNGQSCIAAKRFIVVEELYEGFVERVVEIVAKMKSGSPEDPTSDVGPFARLDLLEDLDEQIHKSLAMGAVLKTGGYRLPGEGFYYQPAVVCELTQEMPLFREESFGPVLAVIKAKNDDDAVHLANNSIYGLGGSLWTRDLEKGIRLARRIDSGAVFVNGMTKSDPRLPFGGIKKSGYGRELSHYGIREFVNIKTIWLGE